MFPFSISCLNKPSCRKELSSSSSNSIKPKGKVKLILGFWSVVALLKGLFFALASYLQHNDPDPYLWIPAYGIPAFLSFYMSNHLIQGFKSQIPLFPSWIDKLILLQIIYCFSLGIYTLFISGEEALEQFTREGAKMMHEEAKELMGLCITILWLGVMVNANFLWVRVWVGVAILLGPVVSWAVMESIEQC